MPLWWGKSSCKEVQGKTNRGGFVNSIQRKINSRLEDKKTGKSAGSGKYSLDACSEKRSLSDSALPSLQVSRCHCFAEPPHAQPLPLPVQPTSVVGPAVSRHCPTSLELHGCSKPLPNSDFLSRHGYDREHPLALDAWGHCATSSISSNSSGDTNDQPDSQLLSPQASDYESGNVNAISSPSRYSLFHQLLSFHYL